MRDERNRVMPKIEQIKTITFNRTVEEELEYQLREAQQRFNYYTARYFCALNCLGQCQPQKPRKHVDSRLINRRFWRL